ncbi:TetR/AcrR family transcriptional regulator [Actinocatenispora rupis]|uniref:TetR family transcriptional regulator n=1 Tax=Actinocatenispora rupis TaxID=519421 RepID=A0A8J3JBC0_9ACTN|nr:TetR/AcrR family transcriptional regulator [Actinocatenispora rupis]GID12868.1 TetR family transcriptional regulator [Actinocatenispora rupis]
MSEHNATAARPPGRPRSARADEAIIEAALDIIAEGNTVDALSMDAVAARAGVGKATVYRRWSNKEALMMDAIVALKGDIPKPAGESVRADLIALLGRVGRYGGRAGKIMPCLAPEIHRNPELYDRYVAWVEERREVIRDVLRRGIGTGELDPDLDIELAVAALTSPVTMQSQLRWHPHLTKERLAERLVDMVLNGIRPPAR